MAVTIKTAAELTKMRVAGRLTRQVLDMITPYVASGITTDDLNQICHRYIIDELGAIPAPLNYRGFPKSICTSVNHVVCHGIPGKRKLKTGDIINIDVTVIKDGYHGDASRMFTIGDVSIRAQRLINITNECLETGIRLVQPGTRLGDIGAAIQQHAESNGYPGFDFVIIPFLRPIEMASLLVSRGHLQ